MCDCTYLHAAESKDAGRHEAERKRKEREISTCAEERIQPGAFTFTRLQLQLCNVSGWNATWFSHFSEGNIHPTPVYRPPLCRYSPLLFCLIAFHINFASFPERNVFSSPSNDQKSWIGWMWKQCNTLSLLNTTGTCGEPSWLHNEGNVPEDDERNDVLDESAQAPEGHSRPRLYSHTWLCFRKGRNSGGTHVSGCTVKYVAQSKVYRGREPALIKSSRPASICLHLRDLSPSI